MSSDAISMAELSSVVARSWQTDSLKKIRNIRAVVGARAQSAKFTKLVKTITQQKEEINRLQVLANKITSLDTQVKLLALKITSESPEGLTDNLASNGLDDLDYYVARH